MGSTISNLQHRPPTQYILKTSLGLPECIHGDARFKPAPAMKEKKIQSSKFYKQYKRLHKNIVGVSCASPPVIMVNLYIM